MKPNQGEFLEESRVPEGTMTKRKEPRLVEPEPAISSAQCHHDYPELHSAIGFVQQSLRAEISAAVDEFRQTSDKITKDVPTFLQETLATTGYQNLTTYDQKFTALHSGLQQLANQVNNIRIPPPYDPSSIINAIC